MESFEISLWGISKQHGLYLFESKKIIALQAIFENDHPIIKKTVRKQELSYKFQNVFNCFYFIKFTYSFISQVLWSIKRSSAKSNADWRFPYLLLGDY